MLCFANASRTLFGVRVYVFWARKSILSLASLHPDRKVLYPHTLHLCRYIVCYLVRPDGWSILEFRSPTRI